ncbi:MAG TPA: hypothetical protein VGW34_09260 [Allosphingosinicella sp.]|nr:hypothetical protein [Allosphingosinicella sp.]
MPKPSPAISRCTSRARRILIGPDQSWMTTKQFFEAVRANLEKVMAST